MKQLPKFKRSLLSIILFYRGNSYYQCVKDKNAFDKESKTSTESPTPLSFNMMFKSSEEQYGFGLHQPKQNDYELYKRYLMFGDTKLQY